MLVDQKHLDIGTLVMIYHELKHVSIVFGRSLFSNNVRATKAAETKKGIIFDAFVLTSVDASTITD